MALRSQREAAELRGELARARAQSLESDGQDDDDDESDEDRIEAGIRAILDEIPDDGLERHGPPIKKILGGVIRELETLRAERDRQEAREREQGWKKEFQAFKRAHKDWEEYDSEMATLFRRMGVRPRTQEQFEEALDIVKDRKAKPRLERELETTKRAGPVPKLTAGPPSVIERLRASKDRKPARNWNDAFGRAWAETERQSQA